MGESATRSWSKISPRVLNILIKPFATNSTGSKRLGLTATGGYMFGSTSELTVSTPCSLQLKKA